MIAKYSAAIAALSTLVSAGPVARAVAELDPAAFAEAQQRDETATRAFSNAAIKVSRPLAIGWVGISLTNHESQ